MKQAFFAIAAASGMLLAGYSAGAQTLFTYGKKNVTQQEFLKAFQKNPTATQSPTAIQDYLPLYINYKLKVQFAYDEGMDSLPAQQDELYQYQEQLTESFIARQSNTEALVTEAMQRSQHDRFVRHLSIPFEPGNATSEQKAKQLADAAFAQLQSKVAFTKVLNQYSSDEDAKKQGGIVGWITAFTLPYFYETAVYTAKPGSATAPVKGSDAYHLFFVEKERPALGKRKLAQILIWQVGADERQAKKQLADSIFQLLQSGKLAFDAAALQFSNDRASYSNGGVLPLVSVGEYDAVFEQAAFGLTKPGQLSPAFETAHGWHILKLLEIVPAPKADDENAANELRQRVMNTDRAEIAKKNFLRSVMQKMKFQESVINKTDLWRFTDSAVRNGKTTGLSVNNNTVLFSIGKEQTLVENWVMYNRAAGIVNTSAYAARYDAYMLQSANSYYREHLAEFEPAFKEQLQEFKDANLLFAAMEKEVWSKAANDSVALQKHYQQHRQQYTWANGAKALMITATDSLAAERYKKQLLQQPTEWKAIAANMQEQIIADSARFELTQLPALNGASYSNGFCTPLQHNDMDNSYSFVYIFQLMPGGDIRQFEDAKGWVINDYQQVLEKQWIDSLRKKYPVKVNDAVWQTLLRNNK